jgi:hypothetical protein
MRYASVAVVVALLVSGCAAYTLVEPRPVTIAGVLVVEPQIAWSSISSAEWETWTVDGTSLQALQFRTGLAPGDRLFSRGSDKRPRFRTDMTPTEVMEFFVDSMADAGAQQINATGLRPVPFAGTDGFRFEWTLATRQGLAKRGFTVGAIVKDKLYLVAYSGAADHYYAKHVDDAERVVRSARLK